MDVQLKISPDSLKRSYTDLGSLSDHSLIHVMQKKNGLGFIVGLFDDDYFKYFLDIKTRSKSYPVVPRNLSTPYYQISWVSVEDEFAEQGYARSSYKFLISRWDLVSDHEQYIGGQKLWKSISKEHDVYIYVFDGNSNDYVRDSTEKPLRYINDSVDSHFIWGSTAEFSSVLLVASKTEMQE